VAGVLAFHGGIPWARGGFLGVDAFFVLSGYLITMLLLTEWERTGDVALIAFWGRRARRLLPALLLMVAVVSIGARSLLPPEDVRLLRGDGLATLFYVANWRMIFRGGDYFAQTAAPSPLQHAWSLGIEEQFYLLWPLLLLAVLAARQPLRRLLVICACAAVISAFAMALVYDAQGPVRAYYGTDTRGGSLLIGAGLAALLVTRRHPGDVEPGRRRSTMAALAVLAAAATAWSWTHLSGTDNLLYHGGMAASALAVAVVLAHIALVPEGVSARALSLPPLPLLGRISYGVYLWHWPVFLAANAQRTGQRGALLFVLRCLITIGVATLSYVVVERPIRSGVLLRRRSVALLGASCAVAAGVAIVVVATTGAPASPPPGAGRAGADGIDQVSSQPVTSDGPGTGSTATALPTPTRHRAAGQPVVVDVFGDSIAWSLVAYLPKYRGLDVRDRTALGCGVTRAAPYRYFGRTYPRVKSKCRQWPRLWKRAVASDNPDVALVLVGRWETMDRVVDGRWTHVGDPTLDVQLRAELKRAILVAGSHGARVVLATEPYNRRGEQPDGSLYPEDQPQRVTAWNRLLRSVAAVYPEVRVIDFGARVSPDGRFTNDAGGVRVRSDGVHLTPAGVQRWIAPWLVPRLLSAAPK
jgi:peptidoglycan/LPS O-acetylase OafA/YrhL